MNSSHSRCDGEQQPDDTRRDDDDWLWNLLDVDQDETRHDRDHSGRQVDDRTLAENERRSSDRARCGRRHSVHEGFYLRMIDGATKVRRRDDDEEIARQEDADRGSGRTERTGDEVADERHRDHDWTRRDTARS